ncbi:MAG TPA: gamma-glutamyl-phosphate reductase, partial [Ramlibacter sp.]|nr:gamma-glutamyl-phosphate reductase [Ramlibacter sp.]
MNALNVSEYMQTLGLQARQASARMASATAAEKSACLRTLARLLRENVP